MAFNYLGLRQWVRLHGSSIMFVGVVALGMAGIFFYAGDARHSSISLEGFRHLDHHGLVQINLSDGYYRFKLFSEPHQIPDLNEYVTRPNQQGFLRMGFSDANGKFTVRLMENTYNHANLILIEECHIFFLFCRDAGFIELLRQSEKDLSDKWSFDKRGGYTIIARTSIALPNATSVIKGLSSVSSFSVERYLHSRVFTAAQMSLPICERLSPLSDISDLDTPNWARILTGHPRTYAHWCV